MNPARWQRINELFDQAVSLAPTERADFLQVHCAEDETVRREVEALLAIEPAAASFFGQPTADPLTRSRKSQTTRRLNAAPTLLDQSTTTQSLLQPDSRDEDENNANEADGEEPATWFPRLALGGIAAVGLLYLLFGWLALKYLNTERFGFSYGYLGDKFSVLLITPGSPAEGHLQAGDEILSINDERILSRIEPFAVLRQIPADDVCRMWVRRGGAEQTVEFSAAPYRSLSSTRLRYHVYGLPRGLIFLVVGLLILLLRRDDIFARLCVLAFLSLGVMNLRIMLFPLHERLTGYEIWLESSVLILGAGMNFIPVSFHTTLLFPPSANWPSSRFWQGLRNTLYVLSSLLALPLLLTVAAHHRPDVAAWLYAGSTAWFYGYQFVRGLYFPLGLVAICAVLVRNYTLAREVWQRRRIQLVVFGSTLALAPVVLLNLVDLLLRTTGENANLAYNSILWLTDSTTLVFPVIWAYAILTQRVYDVRVVIRRSLQYLLARNVLRLVLLLPLLALVLRIVSRPDQTVREVILGQPLSLALIALVLLSLHYQQQLLAWLDRRFFRAQHTQEQALFELIDELREAEQAPEMCQRVSKRLIEVLHPRFVAFFLQQPGTQEWQLVHHHGVVPEQITLPPDATFLRVLRQRQTALSYPLPRRGISLPPTERHWLEQVQASLLVPLLDSQECLIGLLLLGEKLSEEPYHLTDRRLLLSLARQMATTLEMTTLRVQVERKSRGERDVLARLSPRDSGEYLNLLRECPQCGACGGLTEALCTRCRCELELTLPIERTLEGRYRLKQLLGKGGMGAVYQARDERLRREVAVKVIKADFFGDKEALKRFEREAQTAAQLDHPNIVKVYDYGRTQTGGAATGGAWLVMELARGMTLREVLQQQHSLPVAQITEWLKQLFAGLTAAHRAGVIHRDLKPDNILIASEEAGQTVVKILDFGLAKLRQAGASLTGELTKPGVIIGTPGYMAPEQLTGGKATEQTDIFACGVMVVEMLTGQRPFNGRTRTELLDSINRQAFALPEKNAEIAVLNQALRQCLTNQPAARYRTVAHLEAALLPCLQNLNTCELTSARLTSTHHSTN